MITIIAPAKTFKKMELRDLEYTETEFKYETNELIEILKGYDIDSLCKLMKMSRVLGEINFMRYKEFFDNYDNEYPSILYFYGEVFKGIDVDTLNREELEFAQNNLRILSGLYGMIRPLDIIREYRLEMGTKLKIHNEINLYDYWKVRLTDKIKNEIQDSTGDKILLNLASDEYSKVLDLKDINDTYKVIKIEFKESKRING